MSESTGKRPQRRFDLTAVPSGPHGEFPRQLVGQIDELLDEAVSIRSELAELSAAVDAAARGGGGGLWPRRKAVTNGTGDPYVITLGDGDEDDAPGTCFDDVGASAATQTNLPAIADIDAAGIDRETEVLVFRWFNTSNHAQRIKAAAGTTINVDESTESADGGTVDLLTRGSGIELCLIDDQWRASQVCGSWEIDA